VGAHDRVLAQKMKQPHIRKMVQYWLWLGKSSLLHKDNSQEMKMKEQKRQLRELNYMMKENADGSPLLSPDGISRRKSLRQ